MPYNSGPQSFLHQGPVSWQTIFALIGVGGGDFWMLQAHYMYYALYFYYYYISSNSDHQALDPGGWGPLPYKLHSISHAQSPESSMSAGYFAEAEVRSCSPCPFCPSSGPSALEFSPSPGRSASFFPRGILLPVATCLGLCSWTSLEPTLMQLAPRQVKVQKARLQ